MFSQTHVIFSDRFKYTFPSFQSKNIYFCFLYFVDLIYGWNEEGNEWFQLTVFLRSSQQPGSALTQTKKTLFLNIHGNSPARVANNLTIQSSPTPSYHISNFGWRERMHVVNREIGWIKGEQKKKERKWLWPDDKTTGEPGRDKKN